MIKLNISQSKKTPEWGEEVMKHFKGKGVLTGAIKHEMEVLYRLAAGYFNEKDYQYVLNPYGEEQRKRPELQGDPAKLRNYDIISPVINVYIGDFISRGTQFQAVNPTYDITVERAKEEARLQKENLMAQYREALKEEGLDTELDNQQLPQEEIQKQVERLPDTDSIQGQKALSYIRYNNETDRKFRLGFFDYITVGRFFSYRDAFKDEPYFEIVNPLDFNYVASPDCIFIEDAESAWVEYRLTGAEIIDKYDSILSKDARNFIEASIGDQSELSRAEYAYTDLDPVEEAYAELTGSLAGRTNPTTEGFNLVHMTWKARRKLGKLIQYDVATGAESGFIEVDEDFMPRVDETVEWGNVNETWEGYCLNDEHYFGIRVLPLQRGTLGTDQAKLPFNGRTFGNRTSLPYTPVKKGKYFQELHNVIKYRVERVLAKNKDKIIPIPMGAINDKKMDMFQTLYYTDYHSLLFYDETNIRATQALSAVRPIDASLNQYIAAMYEMSYNVRQEYYETIGLPRQKMADIKASDDVGNTQEAINRGNLLTEDLMVSYEETQERDYQCLLNLSKYTWVGGKKSTFLNAEGALDNLDLDESYSQIPHTVFIKGTKEERRKLEALRQQVQPLAQNGYGATAIGEIIGASNFEELMQKLDYHENKLAQDQQQANQSKLASDEKVKAEELAFKREELESENFNAEADRNKDIEIQAMKSKDSLLSLIYSGEESPDNKDELLAGMSKDVADLNIRREELIEKGKERKSKEYIADTNKNQYDAKK